MVEHNNDDGYGFEDGVMLLDIQTCDIGAKAIKGMKCDKYACTMKDEHGREVMYVHAGVVTPNISNHHRFPEKVLKRDIHTLEDKPVVNWHSKWPNEMLSNFDIIGRVVKAWYNKKKKRAEVVVKMWHKAILDILKERRKDGKPLISGWSVGFRHKFHKEGKVHVSDKVKFHHLGFLPTSDEADKDADVLPIDEDLMAEVEGKVEDVIAFEKEWASEMKKFVEQDGSKIVIMDKSAVEDLLKEYPPEKGEVAWLIMRKNTYRDGWDWDELIISESKPTDKILSDVLSIGDFRMFKVGKDIAEAGFNYSRITDLPKGVRDFTIGKSIKLESSNKSAGSSTIVEAKTMDEEQQKKMEEELAKAKKELEAQAKELETAKAELKTKTEAIEANESTVKDKSDALDAALKEKKEADDAKDVAEKAKKDAEVLLQQEKEKQLEAKVEGLAASGQIEAAKKEDTLNLLKPLDEEGQAKLLDVLSTKAKDVPVGEEQGKKKAEDELGANGLVSDAKADAMSKELYNVGYKELVTGTPSGGEQK